MFTQRHVCARQVGLQLLNPGPLGGGGGRRINADHLQDSSRHGDVRASCDSAQVLRSGAFTRSQIVVRETDSGSFGSFQ